MSCLDGGGRTGIPKERSITDKTSGPRVALRGAQGRPSQAVVTVMFRLRRGSGIRYCSFRRRVPVSPGTTCQKRAGAIMWETSLGGSNRPWAAILEMQ